MSKSTLKLTGLLCAFLFINIHIQAGVIYEEEFYGEEQTAGVLLSWSTTVEENNKLFIIERATDGGEYESIGAVGGNGNSEKHLEYNFLDFDARGSYILYRLKQMDVDGTLSFSKPLFINRLHENNFMVAKMSDMMATDQLEVTFDMMINATMEYHLTNVRGETVIRETKLVEKGLNDIIIDIADVNEGTYKLKLKVDQEEEIITFKKIKSTTPKEQSITAKKN